MTGPTVPSGAVDALREWASACDDDNWPLNDLLLDGVCESVVDVVLAAALPVLRAEIANEIADKITGLARYNCELGYDGTEDRTTAAWVEGIHNAADIARSFADPEGEK
jgi:hypothetical protein